MPCGTCFALLGGPETLNVLWQCVQVMIFSIYMPRAPARRVDQAARFISWLVAEFAVTHQ
jgi:hypothetical protein